MAIINVSNSSQLSSALSAASGGDTILLANGSYGDLTVSQSYASNVTIRAAAEHGASFGIVKLTGSNVTVDGFSINGRLTVSNAKDVGVVNSIGTSWNEVKSSSNVVIADNEFTNTLSIEESTGFRVSGNYIHEVAGDLMRVIGNSSDGVIENNILWDMIPKKFPDGTYIHADALQMFSTSRGTPHDVVIRGNLVYDDPTTGDTGNLWGQGIFLGGPTGGYRNITIEENLVDTESPNAIFISTGISGNVIQNNTVLGSGTIVAKTGNSSGTTIYDNVVKKVVALDGAVARDNYFYTNEGDVFQSAGDGTWESFVPKSGSAIDFGSGFGALGRITELQTGTTTPTPLPEPTPTTQPAPAPVPQPAPTPQPEPVVKPEPAPSIKDAVYSAIGSREINGAGDVIQIAPGQALKLPEATVAMTFNADTVKGSHGLLSKDAYGYGGGGNHFTSYIENGTLVVRFQDGSASKEFRKADIQANVDYDFQFSFGNNKVEAMLDGDVFGSAAFGMSWQTNVEFLQIGANGWASGSGKAGFSDAFDGTISDTVVVSGTRSYSDMQSLLTVPTPLPEPTPTSQPQPEPVVQPEPAPLIKDAVYSAIGSREINGAGDVIQIAPDQAMALSEATVGLTFNADTVKGSHGLLSKDAYGYAGGGNHFTSYIENGTLVVRFQDGSASKEFKIAGIQANVDYDFQFSFGNNKVEAMLDGDVFGSGVFDTSWETNVEFLQIGANGWASGTGKAGFSNAFDGIISDVFIFDDAIITPNASPETWDSYSGYYLEYDMVG
jgi:outer membrane biosynthesis protein TonB